MLQQIAVSMPSVLGAAMETIVQTYMVHTPHGIRAVAPQGHLTSITTPYINFDDRNQ